MDKLKFETPDMVTENIDKIAALFPTAITEMRGEDGEIKRGVNFEVLKQLLSRDVAATNAMNLHGSAKKRRWRKRRGRLRKRCVP